MPENAYRLQNATTLNWTIGGTEYPVAGVSEATIAIQQSVVELYTGDSVTREDSYQEQQTINGEITVRKWDHEIINQILDTGSLDDTAAIPEITLDGTFDAADGDREISVDLVGGTTEEWPVFDLGLGDYGEWTLDVTFDDFNTFEVTDPA